MGATLTITTGCPKGPSELASQSVPCVPGLECGQGLRKLWVFAIRVPPQREPKEEPRRWGFGKLINKQMCKTNMISSDFQAERKLAVVPSRSIFSEFPYQLH